LKEKIHISQKAVPNAHSASTSTTTWLEVGLHFWRELLAKAEEWTTKRPRHHFMPCIETFVDARSPFDCLAMRHASRILMAVLDDLSVISAMRGYTSSFSFLHKVGLVERALVRTIESHLSTSQAKFNILKQMIVASQDLTSPSFEGDECGMVRKRLNFLTSEVRQKAHQLLGEAARLPQSQPMNLITREQHLTRRISEIYRDWSSISLGDRQSIMQELHITDQDEARALQRIEEYLLVKPKEQDREAYDHWVLNGCLTSPTA
jgi:hypothetical protein